MRGIYKLSVSLLYLQFDNHVTYNQKNEHMKMKTLLLTAVATLGLTAATMAQNLPNYVPSNGLVGWWPFNGNANDESLNGNNGMVSGASLMNDRNGVANSSYSFDGVDDKIDCGNGLSLNQFTSELTVAAWIKAPQTVNTDKNILSKYGCNPGGWSLETSQNTFATNFTGCNQSVQSQFNLYNDTWIHIIGVREANKWKVYKNGLLEDSSAIFANYNLNSTYNLIIGVQNDNLNPSTHWEGQIDDIGIWNRALTQQEITNLYKAINCANNTTISPQTNSLTIGSTATFVSSTSDPNPSYVWQSDLGQGFQTLNNYGNYSGVNTNSLSISNVQLSEHNQQIRAISKSGDCIDTSNVAVINILDTCIANVTVYDTLLTTVTDTLIINTTLSLPAPNNENTILIYPNPASDHITIYNGNFTAMIGYSIKITNNAGQEVFLKAINQAQFYVDLSTWSGNGLYFVHLIDPQNNTVTVKKIVLQ